MKRLIQIANGVALVMTVVINYLSNSGVFNGQTMATISAKYQNLFTPSGYAFSIWGLIYLGLLGFVIYLGPFTKATAIKEKICLQIGWWFVISCVVNCLWVLAWLYEYTFITILLMLLLFVSLLLIIRNTNQVLEKSDSGTTIFLRVPFYIYSGWISVALIANIAAYLKKIGWNGFGISETVWTILMFAVAALLHVMMIWKRNMPVFAMEAVWALIAIAYANYQLNYSVYIAAIITTVFIAGNIIVYFIQDLRRSLNPKDRV